jgi:hypothetical protein
MRPLSVFIDRMEDHSLRQSLQDFYRLQDASHTSTAAATHSCFRSYQEFVTSVAAGGATGKAPRVACVDVGYGPDATGKKQDEKADGEPIAHH